MSNLDSLSNRKKHNVEGIEIYFAEKILSDRKYIIFGEEETYHILKVMRHCLGDKIYATDGEGNLYEAIIRTLTNKESQAEIIQRIFFENPLEKIFFWIPSLKNAERLENAIEKCVELGITNFILYKAQRSIGKNFKIERLKKIGVSAIKQSTRFYIPKFDIVEKISDYNFKKKELILFFDQFSGKKMSEFYLREKMSEYEKLHCIFGPEGGLSEKEMDIEAQYKDVITVSTARLRSDTAIISAASLMSCYLLEF